MGDVASRNCVHEFVDTIRKGTKKERSPSTKRALDLGRALGRRAAISTAVALPVMMNHEGLRCTGESCLYVSSRRRAPGAESERNRGVGAIFE